MKPVHILLIIFAITLIVTLQQAYSTNYFRESKSQLPVENLYSEGYGESEKVWDKDVRHFSIIKDTIEGHIYYSVILPEDTFAYDYLTKEELFTVLGQEN